MPILELLQDAQHRLRRRRAQPATAIALELVLGLGDPPVDEQLEVVGLDVDELTEALTKDGDFVLEVGGREGAGFGQLYLAGAVKAGAVVAGLDGVGVAGLCPRLTFGRA